MKLNPDQATTVLGGGACIAILDQVDWSKLATGDHHQIALLAFGVLVAGLGYWTNKTAK
jgi:hypothetical protein